MKKSLFILTIWFVAIAGFAIIQSCDKCDPGGPYNYYIKALTAELKKISGTENINGVDNFVLDRVSANNEGLRFDSLAIAVSHEFTSFTKPVPGLFDISAAYACDPVTNYSDVREIKIISTEDYNATHPKGSDLTDIMEMRDAKTVAGVKVSEIDAKTIYASNAYFTIVEAPEANRQHNLTIKYILTDGKEFTAKLDNVLIRK